MRIWLPPSEGKTNPTAGAPLQLSELAHPELRPHREALIAALAELSCSEDAAQKLKLGPRSLPDLELNLHLETSPAIGALELYTGVLFDALNADTLPEDAHHRLGETVTIFSALFGPLRISDAIPNHRLAIGIKVPPMGNVATWWRNLLGEFEAAVVSETIIDCRPAAYRAIAPAPGAHRIELNAVRLDHLGGRRPVTHLVKKWRGIATRWIINDCGLGTSASHEETVAALSALPEFESASTVETVSAVEFGEIKATRAGGSVQVATIVIPKP